MNLSNRGASNVFNLHGVMPLMRQALLSLLFLVVLAGCASDAKVRQDITTQLKEQAILSPYVSEALFSAEFDFVLDTFIAKLHSKGAQVFFWDKEHGVVSWYDTNSQFVPLPLVSDSVDIPEMQYQRITTWSGYVFASARLVSFGNQTWVKIYATGRDSDSGRRIFSDGTYEGRVLKSVKKTVDQALSGRQIPVQASTRSSHSSKNIPRNYAELFRRRFEGLSQMNISEVVLKGSKIEYPVSATRLWKAILDVTTQYAILPSFNGNERSLVFSRRVTVPVEKTMAPAIHFSWSFSTQNPLNPQVIVDAITGKNTIDGPAQKAMVLTPLDVVMALVVKSASEDSSVLYTALLGKDNLAPTPYVSKNVKASEKEAVEAVLASPIKTGAAIAENELGNQVDFQLFYNENLGTKLLKSLRN